MRSWEIQKKFCLIITFTFHPFVCTSEDNWMIETSRRDQIYFKIHSKIIFWGVERIFDLFMILHQLSNWTSVTNPSASTWIFLIKFWIFELFPLNWQSGSSWPIFSLYFWQYVSHVSLSCSPFSMSCNNFESSLERRRDYFRTQIQLWN